MGDTLSCGCSDTHLCRTCRQLMDDVRDIGAAMNTQAALQRAITKLRASGWVTLLPDEREAVLEALTAPNNEGGG